MTVSSSGNRVTYTGDGSTVAFSFPYRFLANADLAVIVRSVLGVETAKTLNTDYTVTGAGVDAGGTVTFITAPGSGEGVVIYRDPARTQSFSYSPNDAFPAKSHENALDRLTMITQRLSTRVDRALRLTESADTVDLTFEPTPSTFLAFDANGRPVCSLGGLAAPTSALGASLVALTTGAAMAILIGVREPLTANRTYYVRADGSDSNNGLADTAGGAFLTIQKAINTVGALDLKTFNVTIQVRSGTFSGFQLTGPFVGTGTVTVQGDTTTPSNCVISGNAFAAACCYVTGAGKINIAGFKLTSATHVGLYAFGPGSMITVTGKMEFGALNTFAVGAGQWASVFFNSGSVIISGGTSAFLLANIAHISFAVLTVTLTGTPAFSSAFAIAVRNAVIEASGNTFSGGATGSRYAIDSGGIVYTAGGGSSYLPGNAAGSGGTTIGGGYYL